MILYSLLKIFIMLSLIFLPLDLPSVQLHVPDVDYGAVGGYLSREVKNIIITGAPASGKGTQCERIVNKYGVVHISTGDLLRAAVKEESALGMQAHEYMTTGRLVPDELVIDLVKDKLNTSEAKTKGWLLDGFPRTQAQAIAIKNAGINPTHVILLDVPDSILTDRVVWRRTDPLTGKIYHTKWNRPPAGTVVVQRDDDREDKITKRLEQYHGNLASLVEAYKDILVKVDGNKAPDVVFADVDAFLSK